MAPRPTHTSRSRRRSRRAEQRAVIEQAVVLVTPEQEAEIALIAAATGSTSLPLSGRNDSWDAGAAAKSLDTADFPDAYFWVDPDGDAKTKAAYKLGFAEKTGGKLTAVWRGVTAAAGAVQGARGGVQIPSGDVAGVKAKIGSYYTKAAKQYDDDTIKPPWAASSADAVHVLGMLGYTGDIEAFTEDPGETKAIMLAYAEAGQDKTLFDDRFEFWSHELGTEEELGGKPSPGTSKDKRLKENQPVPVEMTVEREALESVRDALTENPLPELPEPEAVLLNGWENVLDEARDQFGEVEGYDEIESRFRLVLEGFTLVADSAIPEAVEQLPPPNGADPVVTPAPDGGSTGDLRWVANIVPEATLTDDGRAMAPGSITWRELPLTLMAMVETSEGGHVGAEVAGRIDEIHRDGNMLKASGVFAPTEYGQMIGQLVGDGTLRGVSVDLAIHQFEVGPESDYFDEEGNWLDQKPEPDENEEEESPSLLDLLFGDDNSIFVVTEGVIGAVTVCPFQAFADATIALAASLVIGESPAVWTTTQQAGYVVTHTAANTVTPAEEPEALVASAVEAGLTPVAPPAAWFDDPELAELTPLTITDDGRIYGHAAPWDTCHLGIPGVCTTAPESETNYAYFLLKEVLCEDGERVPCGTITLGTGHAEKNLGRADATAHYDNTGLAAADVNTGEDDYGIWVAGAIRPDLSAEKARELRGAVLSGDWRNVNGNLELVALLAVNVPGFPVPRARALVASGEDGETEVLALVAAGIHVGVVEANDEIGQAQLTDLQREKIRAYEHVASGRIAGLAARVATVEEFAPMGDCADCDHAFSEHLGDSGPCTMSECDCISYQAPATDEDDES